MAERRPAWVNGIDAFEARLGAGMPFMAEGKGDVLDPVRVRSGIRDSPGVPGLVTLGTNQVTVNPFQAVIADPARPSEGAYLVTLDAQKQLPLQAPHASAHRMDLVVAVVNPDVGVGFEVTVLRGTDSPTLPPPKPAVPSPTYLELAEVLVPASGTPAKVTDRRRFTAALSGILPVSRDADLPNAAGSQIIYRLDRGTLEIVRGGAWTTYRPPRAEGWTVPQLQNQWVNYGFDYTTAAYTKKDDGWVCLRGLVKNGTIDSNGDVPIFTLPVNYRPTQRNLFVVATHPNEAGRVDVRPDGRVSCLKGNNLWVSLDGISFATY